MDLSQLYFKEGGFGAGLRQAQENQMKDLKDLQDYQIKQDAAPIDNAYKQSNTNYHNALAEGQGLQNQYVQATQPDNIAQTNAESQQGLTKAHLEKMQSYVKALFPVASQANGMVDQNGNPVYPGAIQNLRQQGLQALSQIGIPQQHPLYQAMQQIPDKDLVNYLNNTVESTYKQSVNYLTTERAAQGKEKVAEMTNFTKESIADKNNATKIDITKIKGPSSSGSKFSQEQAPPVIKDALKNVNSGNPSTKRAAARSLINYYGNLGETSDDPVVARQALQKAIEYSAILKDAEAQYNAEQKQKADTVTSGRSGSIYTPDSGLATRPPVTPATLGSAPSSKIPGLSPEQQAQLDAIRNKQQQGK